MGAGDRSVPGAVRASGGVRARADRLWLVGATFVAVEPPTNRSLAMQRVTITIDDDLMSELDRLIAARGYQNRSEAVRDLARAGIQQATESGTRTEDCVAALVYVYDHAKRDLPRRLTHAFHDHHDLSVATMHVHLDHASCMEVTVLKGRTEQVRSIAEHVIAERGVKHGRVVLVPVELASERHAHSREGGWPHEHVHVR